jgi:hypothetical protein
VFGIGGEPPPRRRKGYAEPDTGHYVLKWSPLGAVVEHLGRGNDGQTVVLSAGTEKSFNRRIIGSPVTRYRCIEMFPKSLLELEGDPIRL